MEQIGLEAGRKSHKERAARPKVIMKLQQLQLPRSPESDVLKIESGFSVF